MSKPLRSYTFAPQVWITRKERKRTSITRKFTFTGPRTRAFHKSGSSPVVDRFRCSFLCARFPPRSSGYATIRERNVDACILSQRCRNCERNAKLSRARNSDKCKIRCKSSRRRQISFAKKRDDIGETDKSGNFARSSARYQCRSISMDTIRTEKFCTTN